MAQHEGNALLGEEVGHPDEPHSAGTMIREGRRSPAGYDQPDVHEIGLL